MGGYLYLTRQAVENFPYWWMSCRLRTSLDYKNPIIQKKSPPYTWSNTRLLFSWRSFRDSNFEINLNVPLVSETNMGLSTGISLLASYNSDSSSSAHTSYKWGTRAFHVFNTYSFVTELVVDSGPYTTLHAQITCTFRHGWLIFHTRFL